MPDLTDEELGQINFEAGKALNPTYAHLLPSWPSLGAARQRKYIAGAVAVRDAFKASAGNVEALEAS